MTANVKKEKKKRKKEEKKRKKEEKNREKKNNFCVFPLLISQL